MSRAGRTSNLQETEWTLMVYMVSDGPQDPDDGAAAEIGEVDLDDIVKVERDALESAVRALGDAGQVHVAVQIDYLKSPGVFRWSNGAREPTLVRQESSAADPEVLQRFYEWGLTFPARRYALMFWGHSSGPSGLFTDEIPTFELGRGDAGPHAQYTIASQGLIPVAMEANEKNEPRALPAWPYDKMLACLDDRDTDIVVKGLVNELGKHYGERENRGHHIDVPIAALKLDEVAKVKEPLNNLRAQIQREMDNPHTVDQIEGAFRRAFRGVVDGDPMLIDVSSLCDRLEELNNIESLTAAADTLRACLQTLVFVRCPDKRTAFNGVNVYCYPPLPQERIGTNIGLANGSHYEQLQLNKSTQWHTVALAGTPSALARARYL